MQRGDSERLAFNDGEFDAVMVAFGVRNFENLDKGLSEMFRVLRTGGKMVILEFSKPCSFPFRQIYSFYFKNILPFLGGKISKDREAYLYLQRSVFGFPDGQLFLDRLNRMGFRDTKFKPLSLGICTIYTGYKPEEENALAAHEN